MKGKIKGLLLGLLCLFVTTGCVKHNVTMSVNSNKSVTLEVIYGMDESMSDGSEATTEYYEFLKEFGYKVESYSEKKDDDSKVVGVKVSKTFDNIDDITTDKENKINMVTAFDEENKDNIKELKFFYKDGDKYVSNFYFDYTGGEEGMDMSSYESQFDLKYTLKVNGKVSEHNATKVDGKEYIWDLKYSKPNDIIVKFKPSAINTVLFVIIGAAIAIVAVIVVVIILTKKGGKNGAVANQMMNNYEAPISNQMPEQNINPVSAPEVTPIPEPINNPVPEVPVSPVPGPVDNSVAEQNIEKSRKRVFDKKRHFQKRALRELMTILNRTQFF